MFEPNFFSVSENALTVSFDGSISVELNEIVLQLAETLEKTQFNGFLEVLPAYSSLTVFYDVLTVKKNYPQFSTTFEAVQNFVDNSLKNLSQIKKKDSQTFEIPVSFDKDSALDLDFVCEFAKISPSEYIEIFTSQTYRVFMLGFLPAFAYMGTVDEKIAVPRKDSPRLQVPQGSVGIAGNQTGIYPLTSPGGWQIIGKTTTEIFNLKTENPSLLKAGDLVKFYQT